MIWGIEPSEVSEFDKAKLEDLGFSEDEFGECFYSFKYGSCWMKFQTALNNIEVRFLNNVDRQLLFIEEWSAIKEELQRLGKVEDSLRMGVGNEQAG